eukprot:4038370-Karenia_brevis.AAC.1
MFDWNLIHGPPLRLPRDPFLTQQARHICLSLNFEAGQQPLPMPLPLPLPLPVPLSLPLPLPLP